MPLSIIAVNEGIPRKWHNYSENVNRVGFLSGRLVGSRWENQPSTLHITRLQISFYVKKRRCTFSHCMTYTNSRLIANLMSFFCPPKNSSSPEMRWCKNHIVNKGQLHWNVILNCTQMFGEQVWLTGSYLNCKSIYVPIVRPRLDVVCGGTVSLLRSCYLVASPCKLHVSIRLFSLS